MARTSSPKKVPPCHSTEEDWFAGNQWEVMAIGEHLLKTDPEIGEYLGQLGAEKLEDGMIPSVQSLKDDTKCHRLK